MKEVIMQVASYSSDYPKAPIYVEDLVRCKECKFRNVTEHGKQQYEDYCRWHPWESPDDDDFCSYGERKESE